MKVNPAVPWGKRYQDFEKALHQMPFLLVGGPARAARWMVDQLVVKKFTLNFPNLPRAFDGLTVTHLSDLHLGPLFSLQHHLPPVISVCQELNSDLICCTGDWVDYELTDLPEALRLLDVLRPRLGWFGVLGNHDYHANRWQFLKILRPWLKDRLLINHYGRLTESGESIDICGLDFSIGGRRTERGLQALQIVRADRTPFTLGLAHYPDLFDSFRANQQIDLQLSGHTHGGQISWTAAPEPACGPATAQFQYCRGLYQVGNSYLYVSCGLGATIPIRIHCPPEVTQFRLTRVREGLTTAGSPIGC